MSSASGNNDAPPLPPSTDLPNANTGDQRYKRSLPRETTRVTRVFGRSATAREGWLQQPNLHEVFYYFVRTETASYQDSNSMKLRTNPVLSSAETLDIGLGVKAQGLHRDDSIWQQTHMVPRKKYSTVSDMSVGFLFLVSTQRSYTGNVVNTKIVNRGVFDLP